MAKGELGLKFKAEKDCHITLYGAELGGPIYKVYDRQSGALLDTIVISPEIWTASGQQINDEEFPDKTYHPNRYVVGHDQYSGLIVESSGASEEVQVRCGTAPAPLPPRIRVRPIALPPPDFRRAEFDTIVEVAKPIVTTTPAPMPYEFAGTPTPSPGSVFAQEEGCDCKVNVLYLPDRAGVDDRSPDFFDLFPPLNIDEGWEVRVEDPRKVQGYNAKCWVEHLVGWPEGTRPEGTIGAETRMYCKWPTKGGLAKGGLEGFSEDPMGPWPCIPIPDDKFLDPDPFDLRSEEDRKLEYSLEDKEWREYSLGREMRDTFGRGLLEEGEENIPWMGQEADQMWDEMSESQKDGWRKWREMEEEYRKDQDASSKQLKDALDSADKKEEGWEEKIEDWKRYSDDIGKKWNTNDPGFTPSTDPWAPPNWGWSPEKGWHQGSPYIVPHPWSDPFPDPIPDPFLEPDHLPNPSPTTPQPWFEDLEEMFEDLEEMPTGYNPQAEPKSSWQLPDNIPEDANLQEINEIIDSPGLLNRYQLKRLTIERDIPEI